MAADITFEQSQQKLPPAPATRFDHEESTLLSVRGAAILCGEKIANPQSTAGATEKNWREP